MTEILEVALTYPEPGTRHAITVRRVDGRYWGEVASLWRPGIMCADAATPEQALSIALAMCGVVADVRDVGGNDEDHPR